MLDVYIFILSVLYFKIKFSIDIQSTTYTHSSFDVFSELQNNHQIFCYSVMIHFFSFVEDVHYMLSLLSPYVNNKCHSVLSFPYLL